MTAYTNNMRLPRDTLLELVCSQYESDGGWVTVPNGILDKARALVRDGSLIAGPEPQLFMPSKLGMMIGKRDE